MSLHCPARLVVIRPGAAIDLTGRRIAAVYASSAEADAEAAGRFADRLGLRVEVVPALDDPVRRFDIAVQEIGDQHPGETVLLVTRIAEPMEIEYDGNGWAVVG
jgi:hypothetical protein